MQASTESSVATSLLAWYDSQGRRLPWRKRPGEGRQDPYRVWLSEVMLQQTTVAAVGPYYEKFLERWPTVCDLAGADDADVMAAWAGLGYYARARNLLACARAVAARGGRFPEAEEELRTLPGLGAYTAAAIAAIAFDQRAVVVDANVERVVARLHAIGEPLPAGRKAIREAAEAITPADRSGDFAQAMMDLGATVCTFRNPRCLLCPVAPACAGRAAGNPQLYPLKAPKKAKPKRRGRAFFVERDGMILLVRRAARGMLGGMRALPDDGWSAGSDGSGAPPFAASWRSLGLVRHGFTHFDLELQLMLCEDEVCATVAEGDWWPVAELDTAGLPTLFAKAVRLAIVRE